MNFDKEIKDIYSNLYLRKREILNLIIVINSQKCFLEKHELLLQSWFISLNAHWEQYIRELLSKYIYCISLKSSFFIFKDNLYKRTIWKDWDFNINNNIKYDHFRDIIINLFDEKFFSELIIEYRLRVNKRYYTDRKESNFFYEYWEIRIKAIINELVNIRNHYAHGQRSSKKLNENKFKLYFLLIFDLLELLSEKIIKDITEMNFIKSCYSESTLNALNYSLELNLLWENDESFIDFLEKSAYITTKWEHKVNNYFFDENSCELSVNHKKTNKINKFLFKIKDKCIIKDSINRFWKIKFLGRSWNTIELLI